MDEDEYNDFLTWVEFLADHDEERQTALRLKKSRGKKKSDNDE